MGRPTVRYYVNPQIWKVAKWSPGRIGQKLQFHKRAWVVLPKLTKPLLLEFWQFRQHQQGPNIQQLPDIRQFWQCRPPPYLKSQPTGTRWMQPIRLTTSTAPLASLPVGAAGMACAVAQERNCGGITL